MENKILGFGKFVIRNKLIRKVGIDTNLIFSWIQNESYFGKHKPHFCNQKDKLFINYKIFGELMGLLLEEEKDKNPEEIRKIIFEFLRRNKIALLKKRTINLDKLKETFSRLKDNFKNIKESDLLVISIFYCFDIDCIFSADEKHFEEPCRFLGINYERHFEIEMGSEQDVRRMLKNLYPKRYKRKKR